MMIGVVFIAGLLVPSPPPVAVTGVDLRWCTCWWFLAPPPVCGGGVSHDVLFVEADGSDR